MGRRRRVNDTTKLNCNATSSMHENEKGFEDDGKDDNKHGISPLQIPMIPTFVADQTPTPTRFLKSLEESGLFNEICKSSFGEDFKRQSSSEESHGSKQTENSSVLSLPSKSHAPIPSVILESIADEADDDVSTDGMLHGASVGNFASSTVGDDGSDFMYDAEQETNIQTAAPVLEQSVEQPVIQVLIQVHNRLVPVNIPINALAQATIPITSPVLIPQTVAPLITASSTQSEITASVKQKLKATVQQNLQHQQLRHVSLKSQRSQPPPPSPPSLKQIQQPPSNRFPTAVNRLIQHNISPGPSLAKAPKLSLIPQASRVTHDSSDALDSFHSLSSRSSDDDDSEEKRKKFLESNRAAANRCRQKKKQWINGLEEKTKHLQEVNKSLTSETALLRKEIAQLKQALLAHKNCHQIAIITSDHLN